MIALAKLDQILAECDPDTHYDRVRSLYSASLYVDDLDAISDDDPYLDWVNQVRSDLSFCSLDLVEEQIAYRWYLEIVCIDNDLPY